MLCLLVVGRSMATIQLKGEDVRQAVKWISEVLKTEPERSFARLIEEASMRFNLSPKDEMSLRKFYEEDNF